MAWIMPEKCNSHVCLTEDYDKDLKIVILDQKYMGVAFFRDSIGKMKNDPYLTLYLTLNFKYLGEGNFLAYNKSLKRTRKS